MKRQWLIDKRKKMHMTQAQLAQAVGRAQHHISAIETGKRGVSVDIAKKIAKVLGFDWTRFYE